FDVAELSFSNYVALRSRGECPYLAIPVFPGRKFRHSAIYVRTDRGIKKPEDLKGRLVGVPEYQVTAVVWMRGMLEDEYGVKPSDIRWRTGGLEQAGRTEKVALKLPAGVELELIPPTRTLSEMLASGELDAVIAPRPPSIYTKRVPNVARLFEDYIDAEKAYYKKTGIFPVMHLVGVLESTAKEHPWLPASLFKAFEAAKNIALHDLLVVNIPTVSLPWAEAEAAEAAALMGRDFWPYGIDANRKTIEAFVRYHFGQGLSARPMAIPDLFAASTLEQAKI
ncbi:MAG TPA: PhnD/SsuA/transferrin family substrate-binding protein, partial [Alphaproteobacteria bacterium]|nr:PhnD/SsuA/transferrin family substrate-binding protein [Alphaproteobacteria bacterium]